MKSIIVMLAFQAFLITVVVAGLLTLAGCGGCSPVTFPYCRTAPK